MDATGQAEDTVVIYLSDHGDMVGGHGLFLKQYYAFEECWRVPLVVRWPRGGSAGRTWDRLGSLLDVPRTICELAEAEPFERADGESLVPFLTGDAPEQWRDELFCMFNGAEYLATQRLLIGPRYKLVYNTFDFDELYDLEQDPAELHNLVSDPDHAAIYHGLIRGLWRNIEATQDLLFNQGYPVHRLLPFGPDSRSE